MLDAMPSGAAGMKYQEAKVAFYNRSELAEYWYLAVDLGQGMFDRSSQSITRSPPLGGERGISINRRCLMPSSCVGTRPVRPIRCPAEEESLVQGLGYWDS
jgi:hypothetical protein